MGDTLPNYVAAAVQAAPVYLDRDATVDKACGLIDEAGRAGARLIVFPETWVPMYPFWHTSPNVFSADLFVRLWKNSVEVPSPSTVKLGEAARRANAYLVIGINERDTVTRGTIYNSLLYFGPDGALLHKHRKLIPSFTERTLWGWGDGSDLSVLETPIGRVGGLICWEHIVTLAKYALYAQGEQVHCAVWPAYTGQNDHIDYGTRQYAFEGACFVVSACGIVPEGSMPADINPEGLRANGGSAIIGPGGKYLAGPVYDAEEILYAEINLDAAIAEKHSRDVAGHYARPDIFRLVMDRAPKPLVADARPSAALVESHNGYAPIATLSSLSVRAEMDRLAAVRAYLDSLMDRIGPDGDGEISEALAEALASIDMAAAGMWRSD